MWTPSERALSAAEQYWHLRRNPLCKGAGQLLVGRLVWRYQTSPSPLSRLYSVRIEYRQGSSPRVFADEPDLVALAGDRRLPHVYEQCPPRLCLYLPDCGEWCPWMRIDATIVQWVSLWLFYFEEWLVSNEWKGGGLHPDVSRRHARRNGPRQSRTAR
jgi:hypothetical protein